MLECTNNDRVVHIRIDAPPVNVLDGAILSALADRLEETAPDPDVNAVLISGEGRCFSAGASVAEHHRELAPAMIGALRRACTALADHPVPAIALVHGACLGGAMEVISCCDFVVADPGATFGQPEVKLAFFPPIAAAMLPRLAGYQNAAYSVLTGQNLSADQAASMGVVQLLLEKERWGEIDKIFNDLSGSALRMAKKALRIGCEGMPNDRLDALDHLFLNDMYEIEDVEEGIASFAERRKPRWSHR